jgi:hypothetical protein
MAFPNRFGNASVEAALPNEIMGLDSTSGTMRECYVIRNGSFLGAIEQLVEAVPGGEEAAQGSIVSLWNKCRGTTRLRLLGSSAVAFCR